MKKMGWDKILVLGGAGLTGKQVCRQLAQEFSPTEMAVGHLVLSEAEEVCQELAVEFPAIQFLPVGGNMFVPAELAFVDPAELGQMKQARAMIFNATYGSFTEALAGSYLVKVIRDFAPAAIIDCVNTATAISYQNVFNGAHKVQQGIGVGKGLTEDLQQDMEGLVISQSTPQLIRHVNLLLQACKEVGTGIYIKVGTTGTGGLGLNIPYTHGEDKPSPTLMAKTAVAFAHTGLLFLAARTPDTPIIKEIKPAAMIGYKWVQYKAVQKGGKPRYLYSNAECSLEDLKLLETQQPIQEGDFENLGELLTTVVDTGENGVFTRGEFAAITAMGQMEMITPEEIAEVISREMGGYNTGSDMIAACDSAVMDSTYKAGMLRQRALIRAAKMEERNGDHSIALGILGPPELSKLLFEMSLIQGAGVNKLKDISKFDAATLREAVLEFQETQDGQYILSQATSVGVPVLKSDNVLLRGPNLNIPQKQGNQTLFPVDADSIDHWAEKGWVDLRTGNMQLWIARMSKINEAKSSQEDRGSAAFTLDSNVHSKFEVGDVIAWVFATEMGGFRVKP